MRKEGKILILVGRDLKNKLFRDKADNKKQHRNKADVNLSQNSETTPKYPLCETFKFKLITKSVIWLVILWIVLVEVSSDVSRFGDGIKHRTGQIYLI